MDGTRRVFLGFSVAVILVTSCRAQDKPVVSRSPFSEEQLSVYRGFLDMLSVLHSRNLSTVSMPFDFTGFPETQPCLNGIELGNVSEAQRIVHTFGPEITKGRDLKLEPQQVGSELNYLVLSEIVFDKKHQFAVVKYLLRCGEHCASGTVRVMEKVNGKWVVSSRPACAGLIDH